MIDFFDRHQKVILQLSAGKDSAAVLWLLRPYWDLLDVVWCNQGRPYPETEKYMLSIAEMVPNFKMIMGNSPLWIKKNGHPVDILPMESTSIGQKFTRQDNPKLSFYWDCCNANMWYPMEQFVKQEGYTGVIRGQRNDEFLQGVVRDGSVIDGIEYSLPIANWTAEQVLEYLGDMVPASYKRGLTSSLDCMNCTAYLRETAGRLSDLEQINKDVYEEVKSVHLYLKKKCNEYSSLLK